MSFRRVALLVLVPLLVWAQSAPWPTYGWPAAAPETQGLDAARLEEASQFITANCPTRYSLLVVRNGYLVFERYYNGSYASQANNIKSMSKSVLSVLTGIAIQEGRIRGVDQKLHEFYPEYFHDGLDPRKCEITLEHLLTMTAGFEWDEFSTITDRLWGSSNWQRTMIEWPMTSDPGQVFNYNTGLTHLLSGILTKVSGTSTLAYARSRLFDPLGMTCQRWTQDPMGIYFGGSEVWLTARDLAKFGLLALRRGRWEDSEIVNPGWLRESTRIHARNGLGWPMGDYGYLWWNKPQQGYPVILASGYGGQYLFLVPDLDLMVVTTANSRIPVENVIVYTQPFDLLSRYILPAVVGPAPSIEPGGIVQSADYTPVLAVGSFGSVFGRGLSLVENTWDADMPADGRLPTSVGGVQIRIGGRKAAVSYAGPNQVNFLIPPDLAPGRHRVELLTARGGASAEVDVADAAPAWFQMERKRVRPGDAVELYASGLGRTDPAAPVGAVIREPLALVSPPEVLVAGRAATVEWSGLVYAGVYQVNVRIPADTPPGEARVQLRVAGRTSASDALLEVVP